MIDQQLDGGASATLGSVRYDAAANPTVLRLLVSTDVAVK